MDTVKEYILKDLYELNPSQRTREMTLEFAAWIQASHNDEYQDVVDNIDIDDFVVSLTSYSFSDTGRQVRFVQDQLVAFMDAYIDQQREDIGYDQEDDQESDEELRRDFERTELKAMGRFSV